MYKGKLNNKNGVLIKDDFVMVQYLKQSKSGSIKKGDIARVSKSNANYLIRYKIAKII